MRSLVAALALTALSAAAQAPTDVRIALVIGNAAYAGAAALDNPTKDAKAMGEVLRGLGFTVVEVRDGSKTQMSEAIAQVQANLKGKQAIGMLYYAGHGLQLDWRNYMVPVDAKLRQAADVPAQTVELAQVIEAFKTAGNRMNIVVLDACRDNPFGGSASGKGLAQLDAPPGTFLAYATAPGNVAEDGDSKSGNGLYTQYLLEELKKPSAKIEDVFKRVRLNVRKQSQGRQIPWESTSLEDDFYFNSGLKPSQPLDDSVKEKSFALEKADWDKIKDSKSADDFYAYLQKYPNGSISEQAQFAVDRLQKAAIVLGPNKQGITALAAGANRYKVGDSFTMELRDGFSNAVTSRNVYKVTAADDVRVILNGGEAELDQMGGVVKNRLGTKDPAILQVPADLAIGKKWRSTFVNTRDGQNSTNNYWDAKIVALEELDLPIGKIMAFKVERNGRAVGRNGVTVQTGTSWIDPKTMMIVRSDLLFRNNGKITEYSSSVMVALQKSP